MLYNSDLYDTTDYANNLWGVGLMYMDMEEVHKAQNRIDTVWDIYSEVWKARSKLLEAKYTGIQLYALKTLFTRTKINKAKYNNISNR